MASQISIREALMMIDSVSQRFKQVLGEKPGGWQRDYIELRRALHDAVAALGAAGRRELANHPQIRTFEDAHARVRHLLLLHQARWPVVSLDLDSKDYTASLREIAETSATFMAIIDRMQRKAA
jgi:hypothetical protein